MPDRIFNRLSHKTRWVLASLFVVIVSFVLVGLTVTLYDQRAEVKALQAERAAEAQAETEAANSQQVARCIAGVYDVPRLLAALDGLDAALLNQLRAAEAALDEMPNSPLTPNRRATVLRAQRARENVNRLVAGEDGNGGIWAQRRTLLQCRTLAKELGVNIKPFLEDREEEQR